jgi:hypothetical protein
MEVTDCDWTQLDSWWESTADLNQSLLTDADSLVLDSRLLSGQWASIADWWLSYVTSDQPPLGDDTTTTLNDRSLEDGWADLDDWWQTYSETRQKDVKELLAVLDMADETWAAGLSQFGADPLSVDWQTAQGSTGPIRLSREEDWSFALANLFRSESGVLINELFDIPYEGGPVNVETEAHLPGRSETTRYEDILITYPGRGISIEVKIGDTNLQKTVKTASLVERHHSGDWTHILLLPSYQHSHLRDTFGEALSEPATSPPVIEATPFDKQEIEVQVRNWQEISTALRAILQRNDELQPHWAASAYVVCTLIEQRILGFIPKPVVERLASTDDIVHDDVSLTVSIGDIESEISYLTSTTEDTQYE